VDAVWSSDANQTRCPNVSNRTHRPFYTLLEVLTGTVFALSWSTKSNTACVTHACLRGGPGRRAPPILPWYGSRASTCDCGNALLTEPNRTSPLKSIDQFIGCQVGQCGTHYRIQAGHHHHPDVRLTESNRTPLLKLILSNHWLSSRANMVLYYRIKAGHDYHPDVRNQPNRKRSGRRPKGST